MATEDKNQNSSENDEDKNQNKSSSSGTENKDEKKEEVKGSAKKEGKSSGKGKAKKSSKKQEVSASAKKEEQKQEEKEQEESGKTYSTVSQGPSYQYGTGQENQTTETTGPSDFDQFRQSKQYEGPRQGHGYSQTGISDAPYQRGEYPRGGYPQSRYENGGHSVGSSQRTMENRSGQQAAYRGQQPSGYSQQGRQFREPSNEWQRTGATSDQSWWDSGNRQQGQVYRGENQYPYRENYEERNQQGQPGVANMYPQEPASSRQRRNFAEGAQYPYEAGYGANTWQEREGMERADEWKNRQQTGGAPQQSYGGESQYPYGGNFGERKEQGPMQHQKSEMEGNQYPYGGNFGERSPEGAEQEEQKGPGHQQDYQSQPQQSQEPQIPTSHSQEFQAREFPAQDFHSQGPGYHQPTGRLEGGAYRTPGWVKSQQKEESGGADYGQTSSGQPSPGWDQNQFRNPNQISNQNPNTMRSEERDYRRDRDYNENRYQDYGRERNQRGDMDYNYGAGMSGQRDYERGGYNRERDMSGSYDRMHESERSPIQRAGSNYDQDMYGPTGQRGSERDYGRYGTERGEYSGRGYAGDRDFGRDQGYGGYDRNRGYGGESNRYNQGDRNYRESQSRFGTASGMGASDYNRDRSYGVGRDYESDRAQSAISGGTNYGSYGSSMGDAGRYGYDRDYQSRNSYYDRGGYDRDRDLGYRGREEDRRGGEWGSSDYDRDRNYDYNERYEGNRRDRY